MVGNLFVSLQCCASSDHRCGGERRTTDAQGEDLRNPDFDPGRDQQAGGWSIYGG